MMRYVATNISQISEYKFIVQLSDLDTNVLYLRQYLWNREL